MELAAAGLVKRHPGVLALDGVSITLRGGEVHAVVGENGAGKSTLMRVLSGATIPDEGTLTLDGQPLPLRTPHDAHAAGIRMIHQELSLVPELTVAENIFLGAEPAQWGVVNRARQRAAARAVLDRLSQPQLPPDVPVQSLSLASRQMTEIAKAVVQQVRVLILDEPTAILAQEETDALFAVLRQLRESGVAIAYISHRLDEVFRIADRITVLRDGRTVASAPAADTSRDDIVRQMVGRELSAGYPAPVVARGELLLAVEHIASGPVRDASLTVHRGEIVALVGLVGAGRTDVVRAIFGAAPITRGRMTLNGQPYQPRSPRDAIAAGIGLLPEDRKGQGLVLTAAMRENAVLASGNAHARRGIIDRGAEAKAVAHWIDTLAIRTPSQEQAVQLLSGGNQQKVVLARWMLANSRILLFDEPTRGIDVGARAEIYAVMRRLTAEGAAIIMVSSDLPEALGMADRLIVMRHGQSHGELGRDAATPERVARLILGESRAA
ncbi:MAG TPA: sugar ABC transporter ATP-binding protein [Gemmatimonadales bacterium]|nr:sugar ABC transporter ATP-binding protein [Gemmatimonadales bacterium]